MSLASGAIALVSRILTEAAIKGQTGIKSIPNAREIQNKAIFVCQHSFGYTEIRSSFEVDASNQLKIGQRVAHG